MPIYQVAQALHQEPSWTCLLLYPSLEPSASPVSSTFKVDLCTSHILTLGVTITHLDHSCTFELGSPLLPWPPRGYTGALRVAKSRPLVLQMKQRVPCYSLWTITAPLGGGWLTLLRRPGPVSAGRYKEKQDPSRTHTHFCCLHLQAEAVIAVLAWGFLSFLTWHFIYFPISVFETTGMHYFCNNDDNVYKIPSISVKV